MDFAEALRGDPGFRLGFNSAGSSASVNHLHFQVCLSADVHTWANLCACPLYCFSGTLCLSPRPFHCPFFFLCLADPPPRISRLWSFLWCPVYPPHENTEDLTPQPSPPPPVDQCRASPPPPPRRVYCCLCSLCPDTLKCWYFDAGPGGLAIEASKTVHAATIPLRRRGPPAKGAESAAEGGVVEVHTLDGYPIRTLVRVVSI